MKTPLLLLVLVLACGCGSPSFTVSTVNEADSGPTGGATGGTQTVASGGKTGLGAGGAPGSGGTVSSGGSTGSTGGIVVDTDGGHGSGGAVEADACTLVTHYNETGQIWKDCVPLGTYNEAQAMKACGAWAAVQGGTCASGSCASIYKSVYIQTGVTQFIYWAWEGPNTGKLQMSTTLGGTCDDITTWDVFLSGSM